MIFLLPSLQSYFQALPVCSKVTYSHPHLEGMEVLESRQLRFQAATNFSSKAAGIDWKWAPCGRPCAWANVQIDENGMKKWCKHTCFGQKICLIYISVPGRAILRVCWNGGRPPLLQDLHGSFSCHFCPRTCPPRWLKYLTKEKSFDDAHPSQKHSQLQIYCWTALHVDSYRLEDRMRKHFHSQIFMIYVCFLCLVSEVLLPANPAHRRYPKPRGEKKNIDHSHGRFPDVDPGGWWHWPWC